MHFCSRGSQKSPYFLFYTRVSLVVFVCTHQAVLEKEVGYGLSACLFSVLWSICWQEIVEHGDPLVLFIVNVYVNSVVLADCNSCETLPQRCSWNNYLLLQSNQSRECDWVKALEFFKMRSM